VQPDSSAKRVRSVAECLAQYERIKRQKDEYLQTKVVHTDPVTGLIQWSMWSAAPGLSGSLGHGVHYHDSARVGQETDVVAFIRGFGWLRGSGGVTRGYYIRPDAITSAEAITDLKQKIEALVTARTQHFRPETWLSDRIYAYGNC